MAEPSTASASSYTTSRDATLVNLLQLIPSMESYYRQKGYAR